MLPRGSKYIKKANRTPVGADPRIDPEDPPVTQQQRRGRGRPPGRRNKDTASKEAGEEGDAGGKGRDGRDAAQRSASSPQQSAENSSCPLRLVLSTIAAMSYRPLSPEERDLLVKHRAAEDSSVSDLQTAMNTLIAQQELLQKR